MRWQIAMLGAPRLTCAALAAALPFLLLPHKAVAVEGMDIFIQLYSDANCFERHQDYLLVDQVCYANIFSNLSKAFTLTIAGFDEQASADLVDYTNDCITPRLLDRDGLPEPARNYLMGEQSECKRFLGPYWARMTPRPRSNRCDGPQCSRISLAYQTFYNDEECQDFALRFKYPVQNECLRWSNGTQAFTVDPTYTNITQTDYILDDACSEGAPLKRTYLIRNDECLNVYFNNARGSFKWTIERVEPYATSSAWRWRRSTAATAVVLAATLGRLGSLLVPYTI